MIDSLRLAVSNIAWSPHDDDAIAEMLRDEGVRGVEIAPTKWHPSPTDATRAEIAEYRRRWEGRGLSIVAMQSLLFGQPQLQLFGDPASRRALSDYLERIIDLGAALGAGALVFGSPKNRLRGKLSVADANAIGEEFLRGLATHAEASGVAFCLEPVPARYGCDWIQTPSEAVGLVEAVDLRSVRVNADLGAIVLAGEDPASAIDQAGEWIGHYHASELDFAEIASSDGHARAAAALDRAGYAGWVSIEMSARADLDAVDRTRRAVRVAKLIYGGAC